MNLNLSDLEREVLQDIALLHHQGHVLVHSGVKEDQLEAIGQLVLKGLVEVRATAKNQGHDERRVVPTPVGRRMAAQLNTADAVAGASEEEVAA